MKFRRLSIAAIIASLALLILSSIVLARATVPERQGIGQPTSDNQLPIASNYCLSCHSAGDPRLEEPTVWRGGMTAASASPCPAMQKINEELYYTDRLLLVIDSYKDSLPNYIDTSSLDVRLAAGQQGYLRLLDAPVTSLEAFTAEAQAVRFKLGKAYSLVQALDETAKRTRTLAVGILVSLILIGSLAWGLYNTRHVRSMSSTRRRSATIGVAVFLLLVFAFFALPLLRVPAEEVVVDVEAQEVQTTLDTAQRAAVAADRSQARAWMLGKVAASWNADDPAKAEAILAEALAASDEQRKNSVTLWGEGAAAQEAATSDLAKLETAGLIADRLNAGRSRVWELRLIAEEWQEINPEIARQVLEAALQAAGNAQGIYRDLDFRGIAAAYAALDPQRAWQIAQQIEDPAVRAWAMTEIEAESASPAVPTSSDPASAEAQTLARLSKALAGDAMSWQAAWEASLNIPDPFERGRAQVEIARGWAESNPTQAIQAAQQIETPLLRDRAMRFVISITGDASLVSQIENPYDQVMALTALGRYDEAEELASELKETYPLLTLAEELAQVDAQRALALVDQLAREADKAQALRAIAVATQDPTIFERALGMALAARVRNDALAPAQASLDLATAFFGIDPSLAQQALAQAYEIAQRIAIK